MSTSPRLNPTTAANSSERIWEEEILPRLHEYIRIPNKSPAFEPDWAKKGHMDKAVKLIAGWCESQAKHIPGLKVEVVTLKNEKGEERTPVIYMDIPGTGDDTVVLYGHLDKQPEMTGWRAGLSPWEPVREGDKLYGRGGADDGYSAFGSLAAIRLLKEQGIPHSRCVVLIEACEESGSYDLPAYIEHLAPRIGKASLVVCLDSGCANYEQLWMTTSLRGLISGNLRVDILNEGVHSGDASGIVPSSFRILRQVLSRVEDEQTGRIRIDGLQVHIPQARREQAAAVAEVLGEEVYSKFPWVPGSRPVTVDRAEQILNRTWRPALSVTAVEGMPALGSAGNVLRPYTAVKLSMRIPPRVDPKAAIQALKQTLEADPPYGAKVTFEGEKTSAGWDAPPLEKWLEQATHEASRAFFGNPFMAMGEGGTIPFMEMLGKRFPEAQFLITGVLGPNSNAHGPNEYLHIPTGKKLTCCVASVIASHSNR
ncbi:M20 family metallopeptidase [Archangium violaceum]|uniref:M20 family metallopeptidase n=1 Tax=Archangium violaceum TaxID=83451 RepID=UPI002B31DBC2|nr:M20 family metallopeptidase [Archangium gephyra]